MPDPRLAELVAYLAKADHTTSHADFWAGWDAIAGDLADRAWDEKRRPRTARGVHGSVECGGRRGVGRARRADTAVVRTRAWRPRLMTAGLHIA